MPNSHPSGVNEFATGVTRNDRKPSTPTTSVRRITRTSAHSGRFPRLPPLCVHVEPCSRGDAHAVAATANVEISAAPRGVIGRHAAARPGDGRGVDYVRSAAPCQRATTRDRQPSRPGQFGRGVGRTAADTAPRDAQGHERRDLRRGRRAGRGHGRRYQDVWAGTGRAVDRRDAVRLPRIVGAIRHVTRIAAHLAAAATQDHRDRRAQESRHPASIVRIVRKVHCPVRVSQ